MDDDPELLTAGCRAGTNEAAHHPVARRAAQRRGRLAQAWRRLASIFRPPWPLPRPGRAPRRLLRGRLGRGLVAVSLTLAAAVGHAGQDADPGVARDRTVDALAVPHVRGVDPLAQEVVETAAARSPTVAAMIAALQQTDVIVLVATGVLAAPRVTGVAHVLACRQGARYVRVVLRLPGHLGHLVRVLGHELQHALEIAAMPWVCCAGGLAKAYRRIGIDLGRDNYFETEAAARIGRRVALELGGRVR